MSHEKKERKKRNQLHRTEEGVERNDEKTL